MNAAAAPPRLAGVLLDMDGTLVDTEPYWFEAEQEVMGLLGGPWSHEDQRHCVGGPLTRVADYMISKAGVPQPREVVIDWVVEAMVRRVRAHVAPLPGVMDLLAEIRAASVPVALVSSSYRPLVDACVAAVGDHWFAVTVAGDEMVRTKPHPDPYLRAASLLGVDVRRCVAVEDSPPGVASAEAAGCRVLVVPSVSAISDGPGRVVRESLVGVGLADLDALLG